LLSNRADRALALFEELQFWMGETEAYYFPEPNPLFYEKSGWGLGTRRDRLNVLTKLARTLIPGAPDPATPTVLVAPVRAVMARSLPRRDFIKNTRTLNNGQRVTPDELTRSWVDTGYEYAHIVVQSGQFSRRGGILDIWPPGESQPVRIEFFGDEIDTMRAFEPSSQRTVSQLENLTITPAREILPVAAQKAGLPLKDLSEFQIPVAHPFGGSMLDFLPENTLIVLDGQEFISAAVMDIEEESLTRREEAIQAGEIPADFPVPFLTWSEIEDRFGGRGVVELGYTRAPETPLLASAFEPAPRFAGKLRDFINYLTELDQKQEPWVIVSRQSPRLRDLWLDQQLRQEEPPDLKSRFVENSLAGGWILNLPDEGRLHLLTDGEIFGWSRPQPRRRYRPTAEAPESSYADLQPGDWVVHVDHGIGKYVGLV
jgi:transcription-repair coupling factor (superfamily II helicase)